MYKEIPMSYLMTKVSYNLGKVYKMKNFVLGYLVGGILCSYAMIGVINYVYNTRTNRR